jgi:hypothetical protein
MTYGIVMAIVSLISAILGVFIASMIVNALAPSFGSQKDAGRAMQLVAYSATPAWLLAIIGGLFPIVAWLGFLGWAYSIYLMYLGLPAVMKTPEDKRVVYLIVSIICQIAVVMIVAAILTGILLSIFGLGLASIGSYR